ncbi:UDP-N-acetylmuramate dehydrogenase [Alcaligenaceae bacterium SJ-26]|nr:UDP-N-acetylmuramate dehydrogenase [Alcaligenaceae bacterium SJ-26]
MSSMPTQKIHAVMLSISSQDLHSLNTLRLPSRALACVTLEDTGQLPELSVLAQQYPQVHVLGGGSNMVLAPEIGGLTVRVRLHGIRLISESDDAWLVEAGAGEVWHDFVRTCLDQGWPGLENLALIPGTVGAAPVQNIGAYGVEVGSRIDSVLAWHIPQGRMHCLDASECRFAYRDSLFKHAEPGTWLITAVRFRLPRQWRPVLDYPDLQKHPLLARATSTEQGDSAPAGPTARQIFDAVCDIRRAKLPDPRELGNAGSYFKNPVVSTTQWEALHAHHPALPGYLQADGSWKLAAGWLIDQCGWKGKRLGPVGMHTRQALVLVNYGGAQATDVLALEEAVRADVRERFGVELEREPVAWGQP